MRKNYLGALVLGILMTSAIALAQAPKADPKADPKTDSKAEPKTKGHQLPQNWKQLGLTDDQVKKVYSIQDKYNADIAKLEAEFKTLKEKLKKEQAEVLTAEQKKRLEEILKSKAGTDK